MVRILLLIAVMLVMLMQNTFAQTKVEKEFYNRNYDQVQELVDEKIKQNSVSLSELELAANACQLKFDFQSAILYYQMMQDQNEQSKIAIDGLGDCYAALGLHTQALEQFNKILPTDTVSVQFWGKYVVQLFELDKFQDASRVLYALKKYNTGNQFLLKKLIASEYKNRRYNATIELCDAYLQQYPNDLSVYHYKLFALQKSKQYNAAIETGNQILMLDSTNTLALNQIAKISFQHLKNYEIAVEAYRTLNRLEHFEDVNKVKNQGICEYFVGNLEYSTNLLDTLCYFLTEDPFVYFYSGLANDKLGNTDKALEQLKIAAELSVPEYTATIYHHLGRAYAGKRMKDEAIETYLKVREYDPSNYQVLYDIAITYDEFSMNKSYCIPYYEQFVLECDNSASHDLKYAEERIRRIKEEMFFEGN